VYLSDEFSYPGQYTNNDTECFLRLEARKKVKTSKNSAKLSVLPHTRFHLYPATVHCHLYPL